jgi:hypothetical protein
MWFCPTCESAFLKPPKVTPLVLAAADLLAALKDITPALPPADAICHVGICPQDRCANCRRIMAAHAAIAKAEGRS